MCVTQFIMNLSREGNISRSVSCHAYAISSQWVIGSRSLDSISLAHKYAVTIYDFSVS